MLGAYWLKAIADVRSRPWPTALLLLVVACAAALPTVALSVNQMTEDAYQLTLDEANGAHLWLYHHEPARLAEAARAPGVTDSSGPFLQAEARYTSREGSFRLHLWGMPSERPVVGTTNVIDGRWLAPGATDEVVIEAGFADRANLDVGDVIEVTGDGQSASLQVVGIGVNTTKAPYPLEDSVDVFVPSQVAEQFIGSDPEGGLYALGVRLRDPAQAESFAAQLDTNVGPQTIHTGSSWQDISADINEDNLGALVLLGTFTVFAVLAAGFILANTVTGQVLSQRRDIGILKAVGMTPGGVTRLLMVQYLALGLLGGLVGVGVGAWVAPILVGRGATLLHTTAEPVIDPFMWAMVLVGVLLIVLVFTLLPALRAGLTSTLSAISPAPDGRGDARLARVAGKLRLPLPATIALKDAFARPGRSWLTIAALILAVATAMATLTTEATLDSMSSDPRVVGEPTHELVVERTGLYGGIYAREESDATISHDELAALLDANGSVEAWGRRLFVPAEASSTPEFIGSRALEGDPEALGYTITEGRFYSALGEAVVSLRLVRELGLGPGDTIQLQVLGELDMDRPPGVAATLDLRIVGTYAENDEGGMVMYSRDTLESAVVDLANGQYVVNLADGTDAEDAAYDIVQASGGRVSVENVEDQFDRDARDIRTQLRSVMWPLSATLLLIASVNLLATLLFAIREQARDMAILKTIGFTPRQLVISVVTGAACFMAIALAIGAPLGYFAMARIVEYFAREEGWPSGVTAVPELLWLLALIPVALLVAVIGSALPAREVARTNVSETLRVE